MVEQHPGKTKRPWRRVLQGAGIVGVLILLAVGGWIGANFLLREPEPEYLWTESDLPKLPPNPTNGWNVFAGAAGTLGNPNTSSRLVGLTDLAVHVDAKTAWRELQKERDAIADATADSTNRAWIDAVARSYAMPAFADSCPIEFDHDCGTLRLFRAHQVAELAVLKRALDGEWNEAFAGGAMLVRGDFSYVVSTRVLLNQMIAYANASRTLDLLDVLLAGYEEADADDSRRDAAPATFDKVASSLEKLDVAALGMERSVKGEYIFHVTTLSVLEDASGKSKAARVWGPLDPLMYDRGATIKLLNVDFQKLMEFVDGKGATTISRPRFTDSTMWWVRNPVGKVVLDTGRAALVPMLEKGFKESAELIAHRDVLLKRVRKM